MSSPLVISANLAGTPITDNNRYCCFELRADGYRRRISGYIPVYEDGILDRFDFIGYDAFIAAHPFPTAIGSGTVGTGLVGAQPYLPNTWRENCSTWQCLCSGYGHEYTPDFSAGLSDEFAPWHSGYPSRLYQESSYRIGTRLARPAGSNPRVDIEFYEAPIPVPVYSEDGIGEEHFNPSDVTLRWSHIATASHAVTVGPDPSTWPVFKVPIKIGYFIKGAVSTYDQ
jgi:hypothetical protein